MNWRNTLLWANIPEPVSEYLTNADIASTIARHAFEQLINDLPNAAQDQIPWQGMPDAIKDSIDEEEVTKIIRKKIIFWANGIEKGDIFAEN